MSNSSDGNKNNLVSAALVASTLALGGVAHAGKMKTIPESRVPSTVKNPKAGEIIVKCAGIAAKEKNHCGANGHSCGGLAKKDFDKNEWIYVRPEVCDATPGTVVGKKKVVKG